MQRLIFQTIVAAILSALSFAATPVPATHCEQIASGGKLPRTYRTLEERTFEKKLGEQGSENLRPQIKTGNILIDNDNPIQKQMNSAWDPAQLRVPRKPLSAGFVTNKERFDHPTGATQVRYLMIKRPGSDYVIPKEILDFKELIQQIIDHEHAINPLADQYYAFITIDHGHVSKGKKQRDIGAHVDTQYRKSPRIDRVYAATNAAPTIFFTHAFSADGVPETFKDFGPALDRQKDLSQSFRPKPYEIMLFDSYAVHESGSADEDLDRTFVRITFTMRELPSETRTSNSVLETGLAH